MNLTVASQRLAAGLADTASFTLEDSNGTPVDAGGAVTVTITRADGTVLVTGGATVHGETGVYTYALTAGQTATVDLLTAVWSVAGGGQFTTTVEIVGAYHFSIREIRQSHPTLSDVNKYPLADLVRVRTEVEQEAEHICDRAFVPRFRRLVLDGDGERELFVDDNDLRTVTAVTVDGVALTTNQIAELYLQQHRIIERKIGDFWTLGRGNVTIAYTFGLDRPSAIFKAAELARVKERLNIGKRGISARATKVTPEGGGGTYDLAPAGTWDTGNPEVDQIYKRWSMRETSDGEGSGATSNRPVSRSLDLNPEYGSLFHGGRR